MIRRKGPILALLTGLNLLNYLDRFVVSAVLPKIQVDLGLTNFMGGLLATVFLVGYFATAPFFGTFGDRVQRKWLLAGGVAVWSLATCASGLATTAGELLVARVFVGVGEASYATIAPTLVDDLTPPAQKGRALAVFYGATPFGAALGYLVGGFIEARWGWRSAFYVAGGPGLVLGLVCLMIAEPARRLSVNKPDVFRDLRALVAAPRYRQAVLGYCASTFAIGAFSYWAPKFLYVRYGLPLKVANFRFGIITVVAGVLATFIGGRWADTKRATLEKDANLPGSPDELESRTVYGLLRICAISGAIGAPLAAASFLAPTPGLFFVLVFACIFALFLNTSPINALVLRTVPVELRASAMALSIFAIHALGDLWSPPLVGLLADSVPIQFAMMVLPLSIAASACLWWPRSAGKS